MDTTPLDQSEEFLRLLTQFERPLSRYAMSMVPHVQDCDELLQESRLVMWRSFDQFERGTDFLAWARQVVFYQVLKYRRRPSRRLFPFSEETLQLLSTTQEATEAELDQRAEELQGCLQRLSADHRQLLQCRYDHEMSIDQIAAQLGKTVAAVYRSLSRVRRMLFDCVNSRIPDGSMP